MDITAKLWNKDCNKNVRKKWTQVDAEDTSGWVKTKSIIRMDSVLPEGIQGRITSIWAFVFVKDDVTQKPYPALKLSYGTTVRVPTPIKKFSVPGATGDFIRVALLDGKIGAVRESTIDIRGKPVATISDAIDEITPLISLPYVWGGTSALDGFDCSGYVQTIFRQMAISLPRNAKNQMMRGEAILKENIKVGDLLFFKNDEGRYHVGIFTGGSSFSHFSAEAGLSLSEVDDAEWSKKFIGARRILK